MNKLALLATLLMFGASGYTADVIHLKNGDRITGQIKEIWDENVTIEPEYSDKFDVEFVHIAYIKSEKAMEVELMDGTKGAYFIEPGERPGKLKLVASYSTVEVALSDIKKTEEVKDWDWDRKADLNSRFNRGNTDSQNFTLQGSTKLNHGDHRYTADISMTRDEQDGVSIKEKDRINAAYNYLFHQDWFFALNVSAERDPIALLDKRISFNPGIGYDVWDDGKRTLNFELGAGYSNEESNGEDESSTSIDWRLDFAYDLSRRDIEIFHNHHIYNNLGGRKNTVFNSQTGFKYDITDDIYLNVQLNYDYDMEPAEGTEPDDLIFLMGAGIDF